MARSNLRRVLYALACATPLLAACNAILGISEYEKAECNGGLACTGDGGPQDDGDTDRDGGRDAGMDAFVVDASGSAPVSWIQFKMPNYPEAGPMATSSVYATAADGGGVFDDVSGRVWRPVGTVEGEKNPKSFADAEKLCETVSTPGIKWRVPTRIELVTLLDFSRGKTPATANDLFKLDKAKYWTSSAYRELLPGTTTAVVTTQKWGVNFEPSGEFMTTLETAAGTPDTARVICIQGL